MVPFFSHSTLQERRYLLILAVVIVLLGSVLPFMMTQSASRASADLHATLNVVCSLLGVIAGLAFVAHYSSLGAPVYLFLGLAFFIGGMLDLMNGLMSFGEQRGWMDLSAKNLERYQLLTYVGGRLQMGLILVLAPSIMERMRKSGGSRFAGSAFTLLVLGLGVAATLLLFRLASPQFVSPKAAVPRPVDLLMGMLFAAALLILILEYHRSRDMLTWWACLSIGIGVVAQFTMAFSREFGDQQFNMAMAYKALAYVVPTVGFPLCQISTAIERRQALDALSDQRSIFRTVLANTPDLIALKDIQYMYQAVNLAFCDYLRRPEPEIIGRNDFELFPEDRARVYRSTDQQVIESGRSQIQDEAVDGAEGRRWYHVLKAPVHDEQGNRIAILSAVRDITELKELEEKLRAMSHTDELTALYNRRGFFCVAEQLLRKARRNQWRALLMYADLDNMKLINDALGHDEGDRALKDVADLLRGSFRESDVLARVGGDEFVVLAVETAENAEAVLVERLQEGVRRHSRTSGRPYQLSLSVGVACFDPQAPASLGDLLSGADSRMYEQKRRKREARQAGAGDPPRT